MNEPFVLYLSGGTMRGVFGAGVVTALEEANVYDRVEAIYASSGGALAGAYFLARQTRLGSSIYYEDLTKNFISVSHFWGGVWDRLEDRYFYHLPEYRVRDAIDLDYLFHVVSEVKPLKLPAALASNIPLFIKVFDLKERNVLYRSIEHDAMPLLRASVSMVPYVHNPVHIGTHDYVDASIIEPIGISEIRRRHPKSKIVVVFSGDAHSKMTSRWKNHIEGFFAYSMYGSSFYSLFARASSLLRKELQTIRKDANAVLIAAPKHSPTLSRTRNPAKLKVTYEMGINAGKQLLSRLSG